MKKRDWILRNTEKRPITWKRDTRVLFVAYAVTDALRSIGNFLHDEN
jgi:hypothetical protein